MKEWIGHYRIVGELGRGGMGVVYRAHEESLGRDVAIKMLGSHLAQDEANVERFVREARSAARLNHPNIVQIYAISEEEGQHYFVMEYVSGTTLQQLLKEHGRMDAAAAARVVLQAASGLQAAHEQGIIHRDIKPANLIIDQRGLVKITDFGLALAIAGATRLTATGMMMGTPGYLSPEQCLDLKIDLRTDIYSLGATFFEMLTGSMPFSADSPLGLIKKIVEVEPPDVRTINPEVNPAIVAVLQRMMAKDREQRYPSCAEVTAELERALAATGQASLGAAFGAPAVVPPASTPAETVGLDVAPTLASGDHLPPPPLITEKVSSATAPAAPAVVAVPSPPRSRALPIVLVLAAVLLVTSMVAVGAAVAWRSGMVERMVAHFAKPTGPEAPSGEASRQPPPPAAGEETSGSENSVGVASPSATDTVLPRPAVPAEAAVPTAAAGGGDSSRALPAGPSRQAVPPAPEQPPAARSVPPPAAAQGSQEPEPVVAQRGVMVVAVGEPLLAGEAESYLEAALAKGGAQLVDEAMLPDVQALLGGDGALPRGELRAAAARHARHLVLVRAEYLGERPLTYMGRSDTAYEARLTVALVDLADGRVLAPPFSGKLEYTHLNVERVVAQNLRPWMRRVADEVRQH